VADPPGVNRVQGSLFQSGKIVGCSFANSGIGTIGQAFLYDCQDTVGEAFQFRASYCVSSIMPYVRDLHPCYISNCQWTARNGELWIAGAPVPSQTAGNDNTWKFELFKVSPDSYDITSQVVIDCSSVTGTGSGARCFAPRPFLDPNDGQFHVNVGLSSSDLSGVQIYETHPTASDWTNPGNWSALVPLTGTGLPMPMFDFDMHYINGKYTAFYAYIPGGGQEYIGVIESTSLTSGFTVVKSGDWAGWSASISSGGAPNGYIEGFYMRQLANGKWIGYIDNDGAGSYYSLSSGTDPVASTWSAPVPIQLNGKSSASPNFIAQGFSAIQLPALVSSSSLGLMGVGGLLADAAAGALIKNPTTRRRGLLTLGGARSRLL
jgi:hypothetical protein